MVFAGPDDSCAFMGYGSENVCVIVVAIECYWMDGWMITVRGLGSVSEGVWERHYFPLPVEFGVKMLTIYHTNTICLSLLSSMYALIISRYFGTLHITSYLEF